MTIKEIAEIASVSIGTVDRVIHNRGRVSPLTRERIERIIAQHGYKPNQIARHLKNNREYKIGVLLPRLRSENAYWKAMYDGMCQAEEELSVFSIHILSYEFDRTVPGSCLKAGKKLLNKKIDALVISPVVPNEAYEILNLLDHIPYVFVDSLLPNAKPLVTVSQNPFKAGYCAARIMNFLQPQSQCFVCIQMHSTTYNLKEKARGFSSYFARFTSIDVFHKIWDASQECIDYFNFLDSIFLEYNNIGGFFVTNDSAFQFKKYLKSRKKIKNFSIVGFDLQGENVHCLLDGSIDMLISQQPDKQGYIAINEIYKKIVLNQTAETNIDMDIQIYFKENLPDFIMGQI